MGRRNSYIESIIDRLISQGKDKRETLIFFSKLTAFFTFLYAFVSGFIMHNYWSMVECSLYGIFCLLLPTLLKRNYNYRILANLFVLGGVINVYFNAFQFGGINSSVMTWTVYIPIVPLLIAKDKDAIRWLFLALTVNIIFWLVNYQRGLSDVEYRISLFNLFVYEGLDLLIFLFSFFFYLSRDKAEKILTQKNLELEQTKIELLESQNSKDIFIANISHEMRNPISIIKGLLNIVEKNEQDENSKVYLNKCVENANQLTSIINDLLDISNLETGRLHTFKANFDLYKLIYASETYFENRVGQKAIQYTIDIHPDTPKLILCDQTRLTQIINNLLDNAIKYTESGNIQLNCFMQDAKICIEVKDTGIGIPEDKLEHIFENFFRVSYDNAVSGTGLGLSIVKKIVKLIDGEIYVTSTMHKGSAFRVEFPYEYDPTLDEPDTEVKLLEIRKKLNGISLLIADDMLLNHLIIENAIHEQLLNCSMDFAIDGEEVLEKLKTSQYDILLMDINMPKKSGIETTQEIRKIYGKKQHIIALSANAQKKDIDYAKKLGFDEYVTKPLDISDLLLKMDSVMHPVSVLE
ncbi:MAG TPA: ATP-binding protein [Chitinophagales bacterium]|nr:ATP-binding protein [Chitinophagales bacterium]